MAVKFKVWGTELPLVLSFVVTLHVRTACLPPKHRGKISHIAHDYRLAFLLKMIRAINFIVSPHPLSIYVA